MGSVDTWPTGARRARTPTPQAAASCRLLRMGTDVFHLPEPAEQHDDVAVAGAHRPKPYYVTPPTERASSGGSVTPIQSFASSGLEIQHQTLRLMVVAQDQQFLYPIQQIVRIGIEHGIALIIDHADDERAP